MSETTVSLPPGSIRPWLAVTEWAPDGAAALLIMTLAIDAEGRVCGMRMARAEDADPFKAGMAAFRLRGEAAGRALGEKGEGHG